ncbi:MAG: MarR family transcriptional regulator [Chloroflexota bacterium]|nr:MarR family transcriptional regulator [Chloroflexia bacterium]MDQ3225980.1 MarR family transcriptional regulator [Chloroflexota bacterium]
MPDLLKSRYRTPGESPGFLLWQVTNLWQRRQRAALKPLGLTHVQFVLLAGIVWLSRENEVVTQSRLAHHAQTDPMMTSQVVRILEQKGLVVRTPHPRDTRANCLRATPQGMELTRQAMLLVEETDEAFFSALQEPPSHLVRLLRQLVEAGKPVVAD